jgi:hypothetical protein
MHRNVHVRFGGGATANLFVRRTCPTQLNIKFVLNQKPAIFAGFFVCPAKPANPAI